VSCLLAIHIGFCLLSVFFRILVSGQVNYVIVDA